MKYVFESAFPSFTNKRLNSIQKKNNLKTNNQLRQWVETP